MNETQAKAAMRKLWGKRAAWRVNDDALRGEERANAIGIYSAAKESLAAAEKARDLRREELLRDPEYVRLCKAAKDANEVLKKSRSRAFARRVIVGYIDGVIGAFNVKGEGDNWHEAIEAASKKDVRS